MTEPLKWAYGVTTVPERLKDLLPRTLASLRTGGFDQPRLFVDGARELGEYAKFNLEVTVRYPNIFTYGNWVLALWEIYVRQPNADRYALFQDDLLTYRNLRGYLEHCQYPDKGYWNLYTFPRNQALSKGRIGWYLSDQFGKGAVGLVFSREAVVVLLSQEYLVCRPQNAHRGQRSVDGGVVTAYKKAGWKEYVHNPSLLQHTGKVSSMRSVSHQTAKSFRGEGFDAMELLECPQPG